MPREATQRLLVRAREQIDDLKIGIPPDQFVCHLCLRVLPVFKATTGHYPSTKAGGGHYVLQCDDCNSRLGRDIESTAARWLSSNDWEMKVGPPGGGGVRIPITVSSDGGPVIDFRFSGATKQWQLLRYLVARSSRPDVLDCHLQRPHYDALRMAILAWSYSEWCNYSGYAYSASAGAHVVRRMLLDGSVPIPTAAVAFFKDPPTAPLGEPEPVLVVHAEKTVNTVQDWDELLGIGVGWGTQLVGILPAAGDSDGMVYKRLEKLATAGKRIQYLPLRPVLTDFGFPKMDQVMIVSDTESDWKMAITDWIQIEDRERLARDEHPYRLSPTASPFREYPPGPIRQFYMIEDTLAEYASLPPYRPRKHREKGIERFEGLGLMAAVRNEEPGVWHLATHMRFVDERPTGYVVFCGTEVPVDDTTQRPPSGIGFDGSGFVCARCAEIRALKPASERPRPPL